MTMDSQPNGNPASKLAIIGAMLVACLVATVGFALLMTHIRDAHLPYAWTLGAMVVFGVLLLTIISIGVRLSNKVGGCAPSPAMERYSRRLLWVMGAYMVILFGVTAIFRQMHPTGVVAYGLAIGPALPIIGVVLIMGRYFNEEKDEFQRALQAQSALWATGFLLSVATVWGFLENFGLASHVEPWVAFPIWAVGLGISRGFLQRKYR